MCSGTGRGGVCEKFGKRMAPLYGKVDDDFVSRLRAVTAKDRVLDAPADREDYAGDMVKGRRCPAKLDPWF